MLFRRWSIWDWLTQYKENIMAMTNVQQGIVSELQQIASELISIQSRLTTIASMWTNEGIASLTDADFAALAPFAHVQAAELAAAAGALVAINTTLGSNATSNWAKLLKIVPGVPR
jgi:predicted unusual protein kinase regulating ubiquinone biosynthesis (AarF/ABC1/UbiB family)